MLSWLKRATGFAGLFLWLGWSARLPWGKVPNHSVLRLSWRCNGKEIKIPIPSDPGLPSHMRLPPEQSYKVQMRSYLLRVFVDGRPVLEKRIEPAGWHRDRPLSVFENIPVQPGEHPVKVEFAPEPMAGITDSEGGPWRGRLEFAAGEVWLVTLVEGQWKTRAR